MQELQARGRMQPQSAAPHRTPRPGPRPEPGAGPPHTGRLSPHASHARTRGDSGRWATTHTVSAAFLGPSERPFNTSLQLPGLCTGHGPRGRNRQEAGGHTEATAPDWMSSGPWPPVKQPPVSDVSGMRLSSGPGRISCNVPHFGGERVARKPGFARRRPNTPMPSRVSWVGGGRRRETTSPDPLLTAACSACDATWRVHGISDGAVNRHREKRDLTPLRGTVRPDCRLDGSGSTAQEGHAVTWRAWCPRKEMYVH